MEVERYRAETPGCKERLHLNNAGSALMPQPVIDAVAEHFALEGQIGGYEAQAVKRSEILAAYESVARLIGAAAQNIAFSENATASFAQALSSIPFAAGDVILTTQNDYSSNQIQFLSLKARFGIEVMHVPESPSGGADVAAFADLIEAHRPKLVCATHVPTNSGLIQDVNEIGAACEAFDTLYLVDACQSVGQLPVDVKQMRCDFLSATTRKFLRGPRGCGFLYVSDRALQKGLEPLFIDMRGARWHSEGTYEPEVTASRFENWEFAWSLVLGTGAAADYALQVQVEQIQLRVSELVEQLREQLATLQGVRVLGETTDVAGIVTCTAGDQDYNALVDTLRMQSINVSAQGREYAVIDYDRKNVTGALRVSPHYYNTTQEIDTAVDAIDQILVR